MPWPTGMLASKPIASRASRVSAARRLTSTSRSRNCGCTSAPTASMRIRASVGHAGVDPGADVEGQVVALGLQRQHGGPRDVVHVDEVHRLLAAAVDDRRLTGPEPVDEVVDHRGVVRAGLLPGPVDVEEPQRDPRQPGPALVEAEQVLRGPLADAVRRERVQRAVLAHRQLLGVAVDGRAGGEHQAAHAVVGGGREDVVAADQVDVHRLVRVGRALVDRHRGVVQDVRGAAHGLVHRAAVPHVLLDQLDVARLGQPGHRLAVAADHAVQDPHPVAALEQQGDGAQPDPAGSAGHEHGAVLGHGAISSSGRAGRRRGRVRRARRAARRPRARRPRPG